MHFSSERRLDGDILERHFMLGEIPGILWTPAVTPAPLILAGHPGGLDGMYPRLVSRATHAAGHGFASLSIELPGGGDRSRVPALEERRVELRAALAAGDPVDGIVDALVLPLVELAVPEWQTALDA